MKVNYKNLIIALQSFRQIGKFINENGRVPTMLEEL
jgi:hypothetical protein